MSSMSMSICLDQCHMSALRKSRVIAFSQIRWIRSLKHYTALAVQWLQKLTLRAHGTRLACVTCRNWLQCHATSAPSEFELCQPCTGERERERPTSISLTFDSLSISSSSSLSDAVYAGGAACRITTAGLGYDP